MAIPVLKFQTERDTGIYRQLMDRRVPAIEVRQIGPCAANRHSRLKITIAARSAVHSEKLDRVQEIHA